MEDDLGAELPLRLQPLAGELARLASLLEADASWRSLQELAARPSETAAEDERQRLHAKLADNANYVAWSHLRAALDLLVRIEQPDVSPPPTEPAIVDDTPAAADEPDDLLRIKGLDADTAARLAAQGVTTFAQIAGWTAQDVRLLRANLGLKRRISQEGWIEQASMLLRQPSDQRRRTAKAAPSTAAVEPAAVVRPALPPPAPLVPPATPVAAPMATGVLVPVAAVDAARSIALQIDDDLPSRPPVAPLNARLFQRAPINGPNRSLLTAIEAAEQARQGRATAPLPPASSTPPPRAGAPRTGEPEPTTQAAPPPAHATVQAPSAKVAPPAKSSASGAAATGERPSTAQSSPVSRRAQAPDPAGQPLLAMVDDEAEVSIVASARPPTARTPVRKASRNSAPDGPILPLDSEIQGGESFDARTIAAQRGVIEEATVEIIHRAPSQVHRSARDPSGAPDRPRPARR